MSTKYLVIEDSDTGLDPSTAQIFDDETAARNEADDSNTDAEIHAIPVYFRLFELKELAQ